MRNDKRKSLRQWMKRMAAWTFLALAICLCVPGSRAYSAGKVVKVTSKTTTANGKEKLTVKGLDKKGKTVWKYTTKSYTSTELSATYCLKKGDRVYVFEGGKLIALKKSSGKKIWTCKNITSAGFVAIADSDKNVYVTGYYDDVVYKINSKGKIAWKTNVSKTGNYWPYKMKVKSGKLTVTYDANDSDPADARTHKVILKTKNGKILKYS